MKQQIDVNTIENFETLDADALRKFIQDFRFEDGGDEIKRLKESIDSLTGENAEIKRKYRDTLSAEERKEAERKEADEKKDKLIAELTREKTVNAYKAQYADIGYTAEQAEKAATALADGDMNALFELQKAHLADHDKQIRIENLNGTPAPPAGNDGGKELNQMSYDELAAYLGSHPNTNLEQ